MTRLKKRLFVLSVSAMTFTALALPVVAQAGRHIP